MNFYLKLLAIKLAVFSFVQVVNANSFDYFSLENTSISRNFKGIYPSKAYPRVVNGKKTGDGEFPTVAALVYNESVFCTGTLIHPRVILTAAHCLEGSDPKEIQVYFGEGVEIGGYIPVKAQYNVVRLGIYPEYRFNPRGWSDHGYLVLDRKVKDIKVSPVMHKPLDIVTKLVPGNKVKVVGYGIRDNYNHIKSGLKHKADLHVVSRNSNEIILSNFHQDSCNGDSGGPIFYFDREINDWVLFSIVSRGPIPCGKPSYPAIYSLAYVPLCWIEKDLGIDVIPGLNCSSVSDDSIVEFNERNKESFVQDCMEPVTENQKYTFNVLKNKFSEKNCQKLYDTLNEAEELDLNNSFLKDLSPLYYLNNLKRLNLQENNLTSIYHLQFIEKLEKVDISWNNVSIEELDLYDEKFDLVGKRLQQHNYYKNSFYHKCRENIFTTMFSYLTNYDETWFIQSLKSFSDQSSCEEASKFIISVGYVVIEDTDYVDYEVINDFKTVDYIYFSEVDHEILKGIEKVEALRYVVISESLIHDLENLKKATQIKRLTITDSYVENIGSLEKLTNLYYLNLSYNDISDISVLKKIPQLKMLNLSQNPIKDFSALSSLNNLLALGLNHTEFQETKLLKNATKMDSLSLTGTPIKTLEGLENLVELTELILMNTKPRDFSALNSLKKLNVLKITESSLSDISFLENMSDLQYINLENNKIVSPTINFSCARLGNVNLNNNELTDVNFLQNCTDLNYLFLESNHIKSVKSLEKLKYLISLNLNKNLVRDISIFKDFKYLSDLYLVRNPVDDSSCPLPNGACHF